MKNRNLLENQREVSLCHNAIADKHRLYGGIASYQPAV